MLLCPYCSQVMQEGFLQGPSAILWDTEVKDGLFLPGEEGFFLVRKLIRPNAVPSHYCKYCRLLLTKAPEKKT